MSLSGLDEPTTLVDAKTGRVIAVQLVLGGEKAEERRELERWFRFRMKWEGTSSKSQPRMSGINYQSQTFGYAAPSPLHRIWAPTMSRFYRDFPEAAAILDSLTLTNWDEFSAAAPVEAAAHADLVTSSIDKDWLINGAPFTSGIINNTAALPYHRDVGNVKGSWSAMLAIRKNVDGGSLDLPEYGVTFGIPDGSITLFDGQGTWHGVTPLERARANAFRFTMVWYARRGFVDVGDAATSLAASQKRATK